VTQAGFADYANISQTGSNNTAIITQQ
jgi:hypothetical protein